MAINSLEIGKRALMAQKAGLDVTSNNIANVNTPGYSRRQVVMTETDPYVLPKVHVGTGVTIDKLRNFREEFFDREIRDTLSRKDAYDIDQKITQRIEAILAEPSENGITELTTKFFTAFEDLAVKPESVPLRSYVLGVSESLVDRFHKIALDMSSVRDETLSSINLQIGEANRLIDEITQLNGSLSSAKSLKGKEAQTYFDKREQALEELSQIVNISVTHNNNGSANVYSGGINLITDIISGEFKVQESVSQSTGERTVSLYVEDRKGALRSVTPQSGKLESYMKHYNTTLDDLDSSSGYSVATEFHRYAAAIAEKVNEISIEGYGMDDASGQSPGRYIFEPSVGEADAYNIEVSSDVKNAPRDLPIASVAREPGNNEIARRIARLAQDSDFLDSATPAEFYANFLGRIGLMASDANSGSETTRLVSDQLESQRQSVIGVNLDEEAVNLIKYQRVFEAASRIVNTTNELLTTLINLGR